MKTFDQLIITTGFLASASPAMADEKPEAGLWTPRTSFSSFPTIIPRRRGESMEEY